MSSSEKDFVMDLTDCVTDLYSAIDLVTDCVTDLTDFLTDLRAAIADQ